MSTTNRDGPATRLHRREMTTCYRDPGVRAGPLRILPRTSMHWIIVDERRPWHDQVVFISQRQGLRVGSEAWAEVRSALVVLSEIEGFSLETTGLA